MLRTWFSVVPFLWMSACEVEPVDADLDGFFEADDCDDTDPARSPVETEVCDGKDNDCDGEIDDEAQGSFAWFEDADGDGHGVRRSQVFACARPPGYAATGDDCRDDDAEKYPSALERCNDEDDDCDGEKDEGLDLTVQWYVDADHDGFGGPAAAGTGCIVNENWVRTSGDCNDASARVYPGAIEACNSFDDDCDGAADDADSDVPAGARTWYRDADADGYGWPLNPITACQVPAGYSVNADDCDDGDPDRSPESVWFRDADHDGSGDPSDAWAVQQCWRPIGYVDDRNDCDDSDAGINSFTPWYLDFDGDGFGADTQALGFGCIRGRDLVSTPGDCDDRDPLVLPGATEVCDSRDNNCDGLADDADPTVHGDKTFFIDRDLDGYGNPAVSSARCAEAAGWSPNSEDCNDRNAFQNPESRWWEDRDRDRLGDPAREWPVARCDGPGGFVLNRSDCDDTNREFHDYTEWFRDRDEDGVGAGDVRHLGCPDESTADLVRATGDCDDRDPSANDGTCIDGLARIRVEVLTDTWSNETGVRVTCDGQRILNVPSGSLTDDLTEYAWDLELDGPVMCQVEVLDSYGDGGPTGRVFLCDQKEVEQYVNGSGGAIFQGEAPACGGGCTDPLAWNWDPTETVSTDTCIYPELDN